ncbi:Band 7 protein [Prochlorococcus sp. MIT 0702]|uniref:prohibitin family protein n=2 Tax=Prochlorococcus TaxID=1218 RepID=UPI000533703B|nr:MULTISPECIES: prohibitin family protein [unclassified Prochlorococcus]KGG28004.1 Band 7 protein [Prochlorococcus sp. MIT 0701]KGG29876.1 Band 7 protein [Prochlorococcus sp. MIT 0702]KGG34445.1 Band 7 protein [Prochlorococcus sp. MIT 0703]
MRSPINNISSVRAGVAPTVMIVGGSIAAIVGLSSIFVVPAGEVGVVTTLGKVSKNPRLPGLNLKIPFVQSVHFFNIRTQVRPENFSSLTKDLQVIEATATIKYAVKQSEAPRIYSTIATGNAEIYERIIQPSLLKALKSVFSKYELVTIATDWNNISQIVETNASAELAKFDYVEVKGLDLTGLKIAEEYRSAIEQKQIAEQQLLKAQTEVKIAGQEAIKFETLNRGLNDRVLYKLFLDKWDGKTQVVPGLNGRMPPVIVGQ